jgi:hypothetical protein
MASIHHKGEAWHCQFMLHGKRHTVRLEKVTQDEAEIKANQVDHLLMRLKQNLLRLPARMDIVTFVSFDGKPPHATPESEILTLGGLRVMDFPHAEREEYGRLPIDMQHLRRREAVEGS